MFRFTRSCGRQSADAIRVYRLVGDIYVALPLGLGRRVVSLHSLLKAVCYRSPTHSAVNNERASSHRRSRRHYLPLLPHQRANSPQQPGRHGWRIRNCRACWRRVKRGRTRSAGMTMLTRDGGVPVCPPLIRKGSLLIRERGIEEHVLSTSHGSTTSEHLSAVPPPPPPPTRNSTGWPLGRSSTGHFDPSRDPRLLYL